MPVAQRGAQDDCIRFTVAGVGPNSNEGDSNSSSSTSSTSVKQTSSSASVTSASTTANAATTTSASVVASATQTGQNVQAFTGSLGASPVPVLLTGGDRPFNVNGNTFLNFGAACQR